MKVAWIPVGDVNIASARLRAYQPCKYLQQHGFDCEIYNQNNFSLYDVVIFQKRFNDSDYKLALDLKNRGAKIIFDLCDNYFVPSKNVDSDSIKSLKRFISISDHITVTTNELAKLIGKKCSVIDDMLDDYPFSFIDVLLSKFFLLSKLVSRKKIIIWFGNSGNKEQESGVYGLIPLIPILNKIARQHKITLIIVTDSESKFVEATQNALFSVVFKKWRRKTLLKFIKISDVCLIPFSKDPFNTVKSNNRGILALSQSVPVIADHIPSYDSLRECILFSDWENNLEQYLNNSELVTTHTSKARSLILTSYSDAMITTRWKEVIEMVYRTHSETPSKASLATGNSVA